MAKSLFSATPSDDSTFFQEMQDEQSALGKQALELFRETPKDEAQEEINHQQAHTSRQLLESLTTGKSFTQLYDEAVNEQEKQRLLTTQISQTITNVQLTFEQKKETIDQLEQSCGNKMYVITFNTLVEKHAISPCFMPEHYQQLITIDTEIQARRDLEISDFMQMIHDLMQTSTTVTDPIERQDIVLKMGIIMILGSGINVRKIHEAELIRLKQEFARLFFEIPPGKNGSGAKKLLKTIKKSYTSIELNADLPRIYPPLAKFVDMIDELLESSKNKESNTSHAWEKFSYMHNAIFTTHRDKMANVIDNVLPAEVAYTSDFETHQKIGALWNIIQDDPKKLQDYFMLLFIIVDARNDAPEMTDNHSATIGESIKYIIDNTDRQRTLQAVYNFDVTKVCPEVAQILAWNSMTFPFELFLQDKGRAWCVEHLTKEWVLRHISFTEQLRTDMDQIANTRKTIGRDGSAKAFTREFMQETIDSVAVSRENLNLKSLIKKVGLDTLKADKDGMWILMKCMTEKLKGAAYNDLQIDAYGNAYFRQESKMSDRDRSNIPSPERERVGTSIDGRSIHLNNESVITAGEYVTTREESYNGHQKWTIYKDFIRGFVKEGHHIDEGVQIMGEVANDCFVCKRRDRHEICQRGKHHPGTRSFSDSDVILSGVSDGWIRKINHADKTITFIDINLDTQLSFSSEDYKKIGEFHEGLAWCTKNETAWAGTYGFIDKTGKEAIPCIYDRVENFSEGLARVRKDGAHYFINQQNEMALSLPEYFSKIDKSASPEKQEFHLQQAHPFKNGFTRVLYTYKNYPRAWSSNPAGYEEAASKKLTRFYDKTGKRLKFPGSMVIREASDFCGGIAKVMLEDGSRGLIDTFGNFYPVSG